jgi:hypothetical protein
MREEPAEPAPAPVSTRPATRPPQEISFHNRLAVRIGFLAALLAVMLFLFPLPMPFLRLPIAFIAGGFLAVYLYSRRTGQMLSIRNGARIGWITGIFSFTLVGILFTAGMVAVSSQGDLAKYFRSQFPANDARTETLTQALHDPATMIAGLLFALVMMFVVLTALPMLGGALGAKVLDRE